MKYNGLACINVPYRYMVYKCIVELERNFIDKETAVLFSGKTEAGTLDDTIGIMADK